MSFKISRIITGNNPDIVLEGKVFNIIALLAFVTCFVSFILNFFIGGFPLFFNILLLICAIFFVLFYYISAFKGITKSLELPLQLLAFVLLTIVWLMSQGVEGSGAFYFFLVTFAFIYSSSRRKYWRVLALYILLAIALLIIDNFYPEFTRHYTSKREQILDLSVNMIVSLLILGFTAILFKQNYDREREKVQKHAEELKNLNATKDKFFSIISHDLRNPFSNLLGLSRQLKTDLDSFSPDEIKERVTLIEESSKRGYDLLENLLEWSMSQTKGLSFKPDEINLKKVIHECLLILENQVASKQIEIVIKVDDTLHIMADYNMLKMILRNLLTNAVKYSNQNGTITIAADRTMENNIQVSVKDEGVGIPEEEIEKLFRIDTKYSTPGTANEFGTGLGLILCKEFVERHKGRIWVESKMGIGSTFNFTLPI